jgi:hypothetical protein
MSQAVENGVRNEVVLELFVFIGINEAKNQNLGEWLLQKGRRCQDATMYNLRRESWFTQAHCSAFRCPSPAKYARS